MNIAFFSSGQASTAIYLSDHVPYKYCKTRIFCVENNGNFNDVAGKLTPRYCVVPVDTMETGKLAVDKIMLELKRYDINLVFLVGWMRICSVEFINALSDNGIQIVNLHPTLPYQLIGKDIYPKIWDMYKEGMVTKTGAMVHCVTSDVDRGRVITSLELDLSKCQSLDEYIDKMRNNTTYPDKPLGIEKQVCLNAIEILYNDWESRKNVICNWEINMNDALDMRMVHRGKVRDSYVSKTYPDWLFIETSDRVSANDIILTHIPTKGYYLNQINKYWHRVFKLDQLVTGTLESVMVVKKFRPIPLEFIIRNKLWGSLWSAYMGGQRVFNGVLLPDGMSKGDIFPNGPIFTPTTKGKKDRPITDNEILKMGILNRVELERIKVMTCELFKRGVSYLAPLGIEMIDTKFELAFDGVGGIHFIDEIFTPDSSRFIINGNQMDKDILRKWVSENEGMILDLPILADGTRDGLLLPGYVSDRLVANYRDFYNMITLNQYVDKLSSVLNITSPYKSAINRIVNPVNAVVIIAGSKTDCDKVVAIRGELYKQGILSLTYYASAHKQTLETLAIINYVESMFVVGMYNKYVYVTLAGMSNALSGVVAANSANIPVIACPPFKDMTDMSVNINSSLMMPSNVPSACILRPDNVAAFCRRTIHIEL